MLTIPLKIPVARDAWCCAWKRSKLKDHAERAYAALVDSMNSVAESKTEFMHQCDTIKGFLDHQLVHWSLRLSEKL